MKSFDQNEINAMLVHGITSLGLVMTSVQIEQMIAYLALLFKWNSVYNLTSIRDPKEMVKQHLLDSLSAVSAFKHARNILDVGSGGGLPGVVLAIAYPNAKISMIDTVNKKTAFLSQVKAELKLKNVTVYTGRVEQLKVENKFDVITSRAFSELNNFVNWSCHLLSDDGEYIAMKGIEPLQEIERLPDNWAVTKIEALQVPGLEVARHLVYMRFIKE